MAEKIDYSKGIYDAKQLGTPKLLILGAQHMFAMFGATVLVPLLTGLSVSTTLLCAGLGTLLFHLITGGIVPAFLGSSFAYLAGYFALTHLVGTAGYESLTKPVALQYACIGVAASSVVYFIVAGFVKACGVKTVMKYFPPVVTGPIIIGIGLVLSPVAVNSCEASWPIALVAILTVIAFSVWGRGMFKIIPILMGVMISYGLALILNAMGVTNADGSAILDFSQAASAGLVGLPPFQICKFHLTPILIMAPIALASMMEHIGDISAISATVGENFIEDPGLHRTLIGDGLATSLSALIGGPANTTYGENTGVLELSHVYDPKVIRLAAIYAVILSMIPKMAEIIGSMPSAIVGGVSFILYGMISAIGVRNIVENKVDFTKSRNLIIAAVILVCGLGFSDGLTFHVLGTDVTLTSLAIAAIAGILLNAILPGNDYEFGKNATGDISRGLGINPQNSDLKEKK